jgi:DNA polymerase III subunit epsilon
MVFFDLEATGPNPQEDRITQVALVRDGGLGSYLQTVNPGLPIPSAVAALTGITDEMVANCPSFVEAAPVVAEALAGAEVLVGFGCLRFDVPLLDAEFGRAGVAFDWSRVAVIDLHALDAVAEPRTLSAVYARLFRHPLLGAHGALADAEACRDIYPELLLRYPALRGKSLDELALLSNHGRRRADPAGKLCYDANGRLCYAFGQHKGTAVADYPGYAQWMLSKDFPASTCRMLERELDRLRDAAMEADDGEFFPNPWDIG